jgi:hypothetical protein
MEKMFRIGRHLDSNSSVLYLKNPQGKSCISQAKGSDLYLGKSVTLYFTLFMHEKFYCMYY